MSPSLVLAKSSDGALDVLAVFAGIALVGVAATFATTRIYARLQRRRWIAAMTAGGWFAMITGVLIGPRGLAVVDTGGMQPLQPLLDIALAWVGLIVGLQLRRPLVSAIPAVLVRWIRNDSVTALLLGFAFAAATWFLLDPAETSDGILVLAALSLAVAFVGWAPETRSLRPTLTPRSGELAQLVQAGGGLGGVLAILLFGFGSLFVRFEGGEAVVVAPWIGVAELALSGSIAILIGLGARVLLRLTSGEPQESLVVTLSLVLLGAGFATALGLSPLLNGLLTGAVVANLRDPHLRDLERALQRAEPGMAVLMLIAAGPLASEANLAHALVLGVAIASIRLVVKPVLARRTLGAAFEDLPARDPLFLGPARVPFVAIAVAIGPAVATDDVVAETVLASIMVATLLGAVLPGLAARRSGQSSEREVAA